MILQNYSNNIQLTNKQTENKKSIKKWYYLFAIPLWVFSSFVVAELIVFYGVHLLRYSGVSFSQINESILSAVSSTIVYLIAIFITVGIPWLIKKQKTTKNELGLSRLPSWMDILITPAGLIIYIVLSAVLSFIVAYFFPSINMKEIQNVGFNSIVQNFEYVLAFITLVVIAPLSEEFLFRGYLFGKLKKYFPVWIAIIITSLLFGAIHGQWDLAIDTFALSVIMCILRQVTNGLWAPILLHMVKNGIAYYIIFISPLFLTTLG